MHIVHHTWEWHMWSVTSWFRACTLYSTLESDTCEVWTHDSDYVHCTPYLRVTYVKCYLIIQSMYIVLHTRESDTCEVWPHVIYWTSGFFTIFSSCSCIVHKYGKQKQQSFKVGLLTNRIKNSSGRNLSMSSNTSTS